MTTDNNPANANTDDINQLDISELMLASLYNSINELLINPSRFDNPQELLVDLLGKYHDTHAAMEQFLLLARIYSNLEHLTKPQLIQELNHAAKTAKKLVVEWYNLIEITNPPQAAPR